MPIICPLLKEKRHMAQYFGDSGFMFGVKDLIVDLDSFANCKSVVGACYKFPKKTKSGSLTPEGDEWNLTEVEVFSCQ